MAGSASKSDVHTGAIDGVVELRDVPSDRLMCEMTREAGTDRVCPALLGGQMMFAVLTGLRGSVTLADLLECDREHLYNEPLRAVTDTTHVRHE